MRLLKLVVPLLPVAELAVFIVVAQQIGAATTLALAVATSLAGILFLRMAGRNTLAEIRAVAAGRVAEADLGRRFFTILAALLLILPGFLTDLLGILLLLPPLQKTLHAALRHGLGARHGQRTGTIDLEPDEWNRVDDGDGTSLPRRPAQSLSPGKPCVSHSGEQGGVS